MPVALVTGASSGIGRATALALANQGYTLTIAGRSPARLHPVLQLIRSRGGEAEAAVFDLASLESVRRGVGEVLSHGRQIDLLVNNAGVGINRRGLTEDGFEVRFGINHLGHFLLTLALLDAMGDGARVVTVASEAHRHVEGIDFRSVRRPGGVIGFREYAVSKLANILFTRELPRRHPWIASRAVHPGLVDTSIIPALLRPALRRRLRSPEAGADTVVWCAVESDLPAGAYFADRGTIVPSPAARDGRLAEELWERCEAWVSA